MSEMTDRSNLRRITYTLPSEAVLRERRYAEFMHECAGWYWTGKDAREKQQHALEVYHLPNDALRTLEQCGDAVAGYVLSWKRRNDVP